MLLNDFRNTENLLKMPEKDKIQKHRKRNTRNVLIHLFSIGDMLARMWRGWRWICAMWWSHIQHYTWRLVYLWKTEILEYWLLDAVSARCMDIIFSFIHFTVKDGVMFLLGVWIKHRLSSYRLYSWWSIIMVNNRWSKAVDHALPWPQNGAWNSDQRPQYRVNSIPVCHGLSHTRRSSNHERQHGGQRRHVTVCSVRSLLSPTLPPPKTCGAEHTFAMKDEEQSYCVMPILQCIASHQLPGLLPNGCWNASGIENQSLVFNLNFFGTCVIVSSTHTFMRQVEFSRELHMHLSCCWCNCVFSTFFVCNSNTG